MNIKYLKTVLGLTSIIAFNTVLSVQAEPVVAEPIVYIETGGRENLRFDPSGLV